jgi:NAD(P)-dependent dehydrogenase (short-subunit alcohol dehydrogenase family)
VSERPGPVAGRVQDRVAVVTGGAGGIGAAIVRRFAAEGARVVIADLDDAAGAALVSDLGDACRFVHTDVTVEDDIAAAVDAAVEQFGALDIMVNNAGRAGVSGSITTTPLDLWQQTTAVLLHSVFLGIKHAGRVMTAQRSGVIVSTASIAGLTGGLAAHGYTTCKHAVIGLTRSAASELAASGIRVNAVAPGGVVTQLTARAHARSEDRVQSTTDALAAASPLGFAALPADVADAVLYLASDESRYVTGHILVVDAGQTAFGGDGWVHGVRARPVEQA